MVRWFSIIALLAVAAGAPVCAEVVQGRARVIDGDTLAIGARKLRLHGIDAPEQDQTCRTGTGQVWPCGKAATARLGALVARGETRCAGTDYDRYDRLVAVCTVAGRDLNARLVAEGLAEAYRKYALDYVPQEEAARAARLGLWQGAHEAPAQVRAAASQSPEPVGNCLIKGNISKNGRIYHTQSSRFYGKTKIDERRGERWFCNEAEALAAGWRPVGG